MPIYLITFTDGTVYRTEGARVESDELGTLIVFTGTDPHEAATLTVSTEVAPGHWRDVRTEGDEAWHD